MKDIDKVKKEMLEDLQCQMTCSDGFGNAPRVHAIGCPRYECSFQRMFDLSQEEKANE